MGLWGGVVVATIGLALSAFAAAPWAQAGLGAALGGVSGNVCDRLRRGAVIDFVDLRFWPVFNLADAAIVGGAATALWELLWRT